jgi:polysaccharide deacetylase 2 family uncharacterized protein YibQ
MLIAAAVAMLVWLDATGQLRPMLTTTPIVVFDLGPAPAGIATETAPAAAAGGDMATADATPSDAAAPTVEADAEAPAEAADTAAAASDAAAETAADAPAEADFGAGAVALSDVPIAGAEAPDTAGAATSENGDAEAAAGPPPAEAAAAADAFATGESSAVAEPAAGTEPTADAADAAETAATAAATADVAADQPAAPLPKPAEPAIDPAALQTAALPSPPRDPNLPWRLYAAPFSDGDPRPRIAIVFTSLGLSDGATEAIIQQLPGAVTLAFSPYSRKLPDWIERARAKGHEVLVELPMEPLNYPEDDPGPLALLSDRPTEDNVTRLVGILDRAEGAVGVAALMGSRFTSNEALIRPILAALGERGFIYVDNGTAPVSVVPALARRIAVPVAINDHFIDTEASRIAIDGRLQQIERIARSEGAAVAFASPYPITIERLIAWIPTLEAKGFVLAPVTATVGHQDLP